MAAAVRLVLKEVDDRLLEGRLLDLVAIATGEAIEAEEPGIVGKDDADGPASRTGVFPVEPEPVGHNDGFAAGEAIETEGGLLLEHLPGAEWKLALRVVGFVGVLVSV